VIRIRDLRGRFQQRNEGRGQPETSASVVPSNCPRSLENRDRASAPSPAGQAYPPRATWSPRSTSRAAPAAGRSTRRNPRRPDTPRACRRCLPWPAGRGPSRTTP
jgi:hypothetical protein